MVRAETVFIQLLYFLPPFLLFIVGLVEFKDAGFSPLIIDTAIVVLFVLLVLLLSKVRKYDLSYFKWVSIITVIMLPFYLLSLSGAIIVMLAIYALYFTAFYFVRLINEGEVMICEYGATLIGSFTPALAVAIFLIFFPGIFRCIWPCSLPVVAITALLVALYAKMFLDIVKLASFKHGSAIVEFSKGSIDFTQVAVFSIIHISPLLSALMFLLLLPFSYSLHDSISSLWFLADLLGALLFLTLILSITYALTSMYTFYSLSKRCHSHPKSLRIVRVDDEKFMSVIEIEAKNPLSDVA